MFDFGGSRCAPTPPPATEAVLERLLEEPSLARGVVHHAVIPRARRPSTARSPAWLDARIRAGLADRGIDRLYTHQAEAVEAVHAGEDVVVVTPTASGKTLCYALPVLQALAEDPSARALFLFPTKALGQDQVAEFAELSRAAGLSIAAATYDGDTPAPIRSAIRTAGQVVVTNPDMLHSAILPHHTKWFQLFEQVRVIVIDELHTYRGVFGSHVANVLRRLLRLCAHYGSNPIIVCCSATIGNPAELADDADRPAAAAHRPQRRAGGRAPRPARRSAAPRRRRPARAARPLTLAQRWALPFLRAGRQTIVFGRARTAVEILLTGLREALREDLGPRSRIRGYRGGYLPTERRAIERGLRDGEILGVVSTNALELGVDIGRLDVSILAGYPGSVAATWQQIGRAGRRSEHQRRRSSSRRRSPVDQYVIHHPEFLLDGTPEEARLDPDNLHVLLAHLRCADVRAAVRAGRGLRARRRPTTCSRSSPRRATSARPSDGRWYWSSENFPASEVSLRTAAPENVVIIDTTPDRPRVLGEVDLFSAQVLVHEQAIYLHESVQYHVDRLDWGERKAYVHQVDVDHYTYANRAVTLKPLDVFARGAGHRRPAGPRRGHGREPRHAVQEAEVRHGRERRLGPDRPARARAPDDGLLADRGARCRRAGGANDLDVALIGAGRAIQTVAAVLLMVDPRDLGLVDPGPLAAPGGADDLPVRGGARRVGLSERLLAAPRRADRRRRGLIDACGCEAAARLHRPAARAGRRRQGAGAALLAELGAPARASCRRHERERHARAAASRTTGPRVRLAPDRRAAGRGPTRRARRAERPSASRTALDGELVGEALGGASSGASRDRRACRSTASASRALPGQPPPDVPLLCLDTETTGLATAAGTLAFLVGLGWWEGDRFRQVQLLLPDHADEPALLAELAAHIPPTAWLVTYNGRGFDWPLLVARYRMARRDAAGPRRPPRPAAVRPPRVPPPDDRRAAADGRDGAARASAARRRRRLGDPGPLPRLPAGRRASR